MGTALKSRNIKRAVYVTTATPLVLLATAGASQAADTPEQAAVKDAVNDNVSASTDMLTTVAVPGIFALLLIATLIAVGVKWGKKFRSATT
jgi:hypothetical protein